MPGARRSLTAPDSPIEIDLRVFYSAIPEEGRALGAPLSGPWDRASIPVERGSQRRLSLRQKGPDAVVLLTSLIKCSLFHR
jgi:hypothetical protein